MKKKVLAFIPARGGSKGVPNKNLKYLNGKPLLQYPVESARSCTYVDRIVLSTDDAQIAEFGRQMEIDVIMRPAELATDTALVMDAVVYTLGELKKQGYEPDIILLLEATAPIRPLKYINEAVEGILKGGYDSATTFTESETSPGRLWKVAGGNVSVFFSGSNPFLPRQSQPVAHRLTGQVYAFTRNILEQESEKKSPLMGRICPVITEGETAVDIDREIDFLICEQIIKYYEPVA